MASSRSTTTWSRRRREDRRGARERGSELGDFGVEARAVAGLERLDDAREHFWRVGRLWRVEQVPVPRAIGNARRIEKRALGAHQREIERGRGVAVRRRVVLHERIGHLSRAIGGACEAVDRGRQRRERRTVRRLGAVCRLGDELADARCGGGRTGRL